MRKFPKLRYPGDPETDGVLGGEVVVTEKLDGANFRWTWNEDGTLDIGTRKVEYQDAPNNENLPKAFEHAVDFIQEQVPDGVPGNDLLSRFTYFGEAMHYHSLKYQDVDYTNPSSGSPYFGEGWPNVVMFDAWDEDEGSWVPWDMMLDFEDELNIPLTEVLARGEGQELKEAGELRIPGESMFGGAPEGIVVRRVDGTVRAKKVSDDFKEKNAQAFDDPNKAQGDAAEFVAAFLTKPRIEKTANKLVDEGKYDHLEMPMMEDLPREVIRDAFAEVGWSDLINGPFEAEWDDDFKDGVRSRASRKCARTLKQLIGEF